ncbi:MAG: mannosyl-3-phosphoglycerate synthase [Hamadaea sp.]|nr:mannosyl-3-phosphoglycerate synthase [Hamadaea sp.]NUR74593.1 mannosyl-3-phosphoglycerate synthase [Hamadaea sp.]NUT03342.1 mannosyl-3-phosphoglycerate synthase [Hamadaea sp.]
MRLEYSYRTERFGAVRISPLQRVVEIDASAADDEVERVQGDGSTRVVGRDTLRGIERDMVIVVPCMNEPRRVIEGVLAGIPHDCLIVLVSNSDRTPVDRYDIELRSLEEYCRLANRPALAVHQSDPGVGAAMKAAGMPEIVDETTGGVRGGKGEAMILAMALAAMSGRRYIGYVDADNYVPGSVHEYCKVYAAGLALADSPYSMVRIAWDSKPKVRDGRLFFSKRGRTSEVTNDFLNRLLAEYSGFGTDAIVTGNAGEHALSLELGLRMRMAGGFAVEPFQFVELFEQFGGVLPDASPVPPEVGVPMLQIGTCNPHFHDNKGDEHVQSMRFQALNVLYHSPVCPPSLRTEILDFLILQGALEPGQEPPRERVYPPVGTLALDRLYDVLAGEATSFRQFGHKVTAVTPRTVVPIERGVIRDTVRETSVLA